MKRFGIILLAFTLLLCFTACQSGAPLTEEELDKIVGDMNLGDKVDLDKYDDAQKDQIKDELDKGGYVVDDDGNLSVKDPISDEDLDNIVGDAVENGKIDLDDYNDAQKDQIKDKLEEEGMTPEDNKNTDGTNPVVPIPDLTDKEVADVLRSWGIDETTAYETGFKVKVDLSKYPKNQQEQLLREAGLYGLELKQEADGTYLVASEIHMDQVEDNPHE